MRVARRMRGGNFKSFMKKAGSWIKDKKILSRAGIFLGKQIPGVAGQVLGAAGKFAAQQGYGKRRRLRRRIRRRRR
jgi:hypothetical protein